MGKLDFCPYDGKKIELNNLAYEIIHPDGWDWNRVKNETIVSDRKRSYIVEQDTRRQEQLDFVDKEKHVILLANPDDEGKSGLTLFEELVKNSESELHHEAYAKNMGSEMASNYDQIMKNIYGMKFDLKHEDESGMNNCSSNMANGKGKCRLHYSYWQGLHTFLDDNNDPVMYAMPCCPYCHNRLPVGWLEADDFIGISLMGHEGVGKTSFLYSLIHNNAYSLEQSLDLSGNSLTIRPAHYESDSKDTIYAHVSEQAKLMCKNNGQCPNSMAETGNMPIFLRAQYGDGAKQKSMIVGIYDNAIRLLGKLDTISGKNANALIEKIYGDMYLFDPRDMNLKDISPRRLSGKSRFVKCDMLSLEEQAELQTHNKNLVVAAGDLLVNRGKKTHTERDDVAKVGNPTMQLYKYAVSKYRRYGNSDVLRCKKFIGVFGKCDLFREQVEKDYSELVSGNSDEGKQKYDEIQKRSKMTAQMLRNYGMLSHEDMDMFCGDYGKGVSWHCISATGCDVIENDHLLGEYKPINIGDPVISCIVSRMKDLGWL